MKKLLFTTTIIFVTILQILAQTPQSFKYQAVVRDGTGNVLTNQTVGFQLSIMQTSETGNSVYTETFTTTTNSYGLVNLLIGEGTPVSGDFTSIDWGTDTYFLKVELDETGGTNYTLINTSELNSVPYALQSNNTEKIQGKNVSITTPGSGQVLKWNGTEWAPADDDVTGGSGVDGVVNSASFSGTTNKTLTLGRSNGLSALTANFTDEVNDADASATNELQVLNFSNDTLYLSDGGQVYMGAYGNLWSTHGNDIYNNNNGYVGVGTDSPTGKFVVKGDSTNLDTALFEVKNAAGQPIFAVYDGGVRVWVDNTINKNNNDKGGFAIGGYRLDKTETHELFRITPDSARIYYDNENTGAGYQGGFAVNSFEGTGGTDNGGTMHLSEENYFIGHNSGENVTSGRYNSTFGYKSGEALKQGNRNIFIGYEAGIANTNANENNFIGYQAGFSNLSGTRNNFMGYLAGYSNTTGYRNTFIGTNAGHDNVDGNYNTCIGHYSAAGADISNYNSFLGTYSGRNADGASSSNFLGYQAGNNATNVTNSIFVGNNSGYYASTADKSILIGSNSGMNAHNAVNTISIGTNSGRNADGSENSIFLGYNSGYNNNSNDNVFIGSYSGYNTTDGFANIFLGYKTGYSNQIGENNIFFGDSAGFNNNANYNIFMGVESGYSNDSGEKNICIGDNAGHDNTSGNQTICIGDNAGFSNTSSNNIFIGTEAGKNTSSATGNTMIGNMAGKENISGAQNTYIGWLAGGQNKQSGNTMIGMWAGWMSDGERNIYIGAGTGEANSSGNNNIILGYVSGNGSTNSNNILLGNSIEGGDNQLKIDIDDSSDPLIYGEFDNDFLRINGNLEANGTFFRIKTNPGSGAVPTNYVYQGGQSGSSQKQYAFAINDALWVTKEAWFDDDITCVHLTQTSDKRFKKNITNIDNAVNKILELNGVYYYWRKDQFPEKGFDNKRQIGFIAQDLEKVFPELVKTDKQGYKSVNYGAMSAVLLEAVKQQQKSINNLQKQIDELKEIIKTK